MTYHEIDTELSKSTDQLFLELGKALSEDIFFVSEPTDEECIQEAHNFFEQQKVRLKQIICGTNIVRSFKENPDRWDKANLFGSILDLLIAVEYKIPGGPSRMALLIVKIGVDKFCPDEK